MTSGIPQGSVLGPTLFILYINDLPGTVASDVYLFADDTKVFSEIKSRIDAENLQTDLNNLGLWSDIWLLKFHAGKCKVMDLGQRNREQYEYELNETNLEHVTSEKDLGVTFDNKLKFSNHISEKVNKANSIMGIIRRSFRHLSCLVFVRLFKALVRPHLEYAATVWSPHLKKDIKLIENVQRRATKQVTGLRELSYEDRLRRLNIPTLAYRRLRGDMIEAYKVSTGYYDERVSDLLAYQRDHIVNDRATRGHSQKLFKRRARLDIRKFSFPFRIVDNWNNLPESVVSAPSVKSFERRLDKHWKNQELVYDYTKAIKKLKPEPVFETIETNEVEDEPELRIEVR